MSDVKIRHYRTKILKSIPAACVIFGSAIIVLFFATASANAENDAVWGSGHVPSLTIDQIQKPYGLPESGCSPEMRYLGDDPVPARVCVIYRDGWRFGKYTYNGPGNWDGVSGYAIAFGKDEKMYRLRISPTVMIGASTAQIRNSNGTNDTLKTLYIIQDFPKRLIKIKNAYTNATEYEFRWESNFFTPMTPRREGLRVSAMGVSRNGKWLAATSDRGVTLTNLETLTTRVVSRKSPSGLTQNPAESEVQLVVSDDGKYIVATGMRMSAVIITVNETCGSLLENDPDYWSLPPCDELNLQSYLSEMFDTFSYAAFPILSLDGLSLNLDLVINRGQSQWVTLHATNRADPTASPLDLSKLDYLALGDSYSSGEGDTEEDIISGNYYLPFTDIKGSEAVPREMCHISSRSYPFVLGKAMNLAEDRVKSIACSGALIAKDYIQDNEDYTGQGGRLGVLNNEGFMQAYKRAALDTFIPGRNQQIEFVKKYKPKAITLTGGGNDAGFGEVAVACAIPNKGSSACRYADTIQGKTALGKGIRNQYSKLVHLYNDLHETSPQTKIYALGYPQFLSDDHAYCAANVRFNQQERIMIRATVIYMNNVIEAAANTAGVKYIDIEQSLGDHVLCNRQEPYVTGLTRSGEISSNIAEWFSQESFHPNAKGHQKIAEAIQNALGGKSFSEFSYCSLPDQTVCPSSNVPIPQIPDFFADAIDNDTVNYTHSNILAKADVQKGVDSFTVQLDGRAPNSISDFQVFSDPIDLGNYTTDVAGKLTVNIPIPENLPAGPHTLQVEATTYSGEPITLWQIIWVAGRTGDIDENGTPDIQQACLFIPDSGLDNDGDSIDDACDSEIGPTITKAPNGTFTNNAEVNTSQGRNKLSTLMGTGFGESSGNIGTIPQLQSKVNSNKEPVAPASLSSDLAVEPLSNHLPLLLLTLAGVVTAACIMYFILKWVASFIGKS